MNRCYWCETNRVHPWHDDGTSNERDIWQWYKGGPRAPYPRDKDN